jgi:hypothetical protein
MTRSFVTFLAFLGLSAAQIFDECPEVSVQPDFETERVS